MGKYERDALEAFASIAKALSDRARIRALMTLRDGELCVCQIINVLQLAPSTVSKHMSILRQAGLVEQRKEGRWHFYKLTPASQRGGSPIARQAMRWATSTLSEDLTILGDGKRLGCMREKDPGELTACYRRLS